MTSKRILALSITSAMVLAACQQPAPVVPVVIGKPTIVSITPGAAVNAGGNGTVTVVTTGGANSGVVSSVTANNSTCNATSTNNYTCFVNVPTGTAAGNYAVNVTVTNNAIAPNNTATGSTNLTVNPPVVNPPVVNPTFTVTGPTGSVNAGNNATFVVSNLVANSGTITGITASLNGVTTSCGLTANGNCLVAIPGGAGSGSYNVVFTATNSAGGTATQTSSVTVVGVVASIAPNATVTRVGTTDTALVTANAGQGATLTSVVLTVTKPDGTTQTFPVTGATSGISSVVDYSSAVSGPGTYVVSLLATNSTNQTATSSFPFNVASPIVVVPPPPLQGGGDNNGGSVNPFGDAALFAFNRATQFTYLVVDQQDSVGTGGGTNLGGSQRLTYVRGTIPIQQLFRIAFASNNTNIPATAIISLENTTNGAVNTLGAVTSLDTFSLNQGEEYLVVARNNPSNGGGLIELGRARIVPDNQSPQTPRVKRVSELSEQLTSAYGYWIRGFDQTPRLELINTPELDDNPQRPGGVGGLPGSKIKPAVGIRHIRYYAVPATNGDPGAVVDLSRLAGVTATANGTAPAGSRLIKVVDFNDLGGAGGGAYPAQFATRLTPNQTNLTQLADGKYVVFAVSVDYLGNVSKLDFADSFILGVDTLAPGGNISVRDRGPLDVQASGALCDRVNIATRRIDAPSDIYPALYFNAGSAIPSDLNIPATSQYGTVLRNGANFATDYAFVSGCALIDGNVADVGVGFDGNNILGNFGSGVGNIAPAGGLDSTAFFFTSPLAFQIDPTTSGVGTFNSAVRTARVVNMNNVSSSQLQAIGQIADLLGNAGPIYSNPYVVDNRAPNITYSGAAANGSNTFTRWFNFGFQVNVEDQISGLRYDAGSFDKGISFFYGTDPINNDSVDDTVVGAYNNTLIQVDPSRLERTRADQQSATYGTNLNLPLPNFDYTAGRFVGGNLNLWTVSADRAGNARGALRQVNVKLADSDPVTVGRPVDLQTDLGTLENGSNTPYRGFTALNRSNAGLVPRGTFDQLNPLLPNSDTSPSSALYAPLEQYGILPNSGNNATPWYELRLANTPENQFRGDTAFTKGVGRVTFAYRLPDPVVYAGQATPEQVNESTVIHINPATYWFSSVYNYQAQSGTGVLLSSQARTGVLNSNPIYQLGGDPAFTTQAACETFFTNKVRCLQLLDSVTYNTSGATAFLGASRSDFVVPGTLGTVVRKNGANEPLFFPVVLNSSADNARDIARKGRFMYNLPEWMGGQTASSQNPLQDNQYIGYIWNTIGQDVTPQGSTNGQGLEPFSAIFDARLGLGQYVLGEDLINFPNGATNPNAFNVDGTSLLDVCRPEFTVANPGNTVCKTGGISVLAYNNYGAFDAQTKSNDLP